MAVPGQAVPRRTWESDGVQGEQAQLGTEARLIPGTVLSKPVRAPGVLEGQGSLQLRPARSGGGGRVLSGC